MADPLSIMGATIEAISITSRIIQYAKGVKRAKKDYENWRRRATHIQLYLEQMRVSPEGTKLDSSVPGYQSFIKAMGLETALLTDNTDPKSLRFGPDAHFGRLKDKLKEIEAKLKSKPGWYHKWLQRGLHPIIKGDVSGMFKDIESLRKDVEFLRTGFAYNLQFEHLRLDKAHHDKVTSRWHEKDVKITLDRLTAMDFEERQNQIYAACFQDTSPPAQWFLNSEEFVAWQEGRAWPLYCHGKPGAGKTVLSSIVIRHLEQHSKQQVKSGRLPVLYVYLDHKETKSQTRSNLIRSILRQLLQLCHRERSALCSEAQDFYKNSQKRVRVDDQEVLKILRAQISSHAFERAYLIVDALDEYPEIDRSYLFTQLQEICPEKLSLFVTSRDRDGINEGHIQCSTCPESKLRYLSVYFMCSTCPEFHICQHCETKNKTCRLGHELSEPKIVYKEVIAPDSEIERFVRCVMKAELGVAEIRRGNDQARTGTVCATRLKLNFPSDPDEINKLVSEISAAIVRTAEGMFLLAKLHLDSLKYQTTLGSLRRALADISAEIGQSYKNLLARIQDARKSDVNLAMRALAWVVHVHTPLKVQELLEAISVESTAHMLLLEEQSNFTTVMRITAGLIIADGEQGPGRIVHRTAQEYFEQNWTEIFPDAQTNLARTMLTYLNFDDLSTPISGYQEDEQMLLRRKKYRFLAYAFTHWGDHVHGLMQDSSIRDAALKLLQSPSRLAAITQAAWNVESEYQGGVTWPVRGKVNTIHVCAWFGLDRCITALLDTTHGAQVDTPDEKYGQTPLMYACMRGHVSTASKLLSLGADLNRVDKEGNNAIFALMKSRQAQVVEELVRQNIDPPLRLNTNAKDIDGRTLVMLAAWHGYDSLLSALLKIPEGDFNLKDSMGDTALTIAAAKDRTSTVKILIDYVDIDLPNALGSTALIIAAERGNAGMVMEIFKHNANWRLQNHDGHTAFSKAIIWGHARVVKVLLDHKATQQVDDHSGRTILHVACSTEQTNLEMIELLLRDQPQINATDSHGRTPLFDASRVGNLDVARALLGSGADQSIKDLHGRTPLLVAWQNGHSDLVTLLRDDSDSRGLVLESIPEDSSLPL